MYLGYWALPGRCVRVRVKCSLGHFDHPQGLRTAGLPSYDLIQDSAAFQDRVIQHCYIALPSCACKQSILAVFSFRQTSLPAAPLDPPLAFSALGSRVAVETPSHNIHSSDSESCQRAQHKLKAKSSLPLAKVFRHGHAFGARVFALWPPWSLNGASTSPLDLASTPLRRIHNH